MTSSKRLCLALLFAGLFLAPAFAQQEDYEDSLPTPVYVPSPQEVVDEMLKFAKVTKDDVVFDLGCGDGRIVISAAKLGARGVGVDINPERIKESNENAEAAGVTGRVKFINGDLFKADISPATVVTLYLLPARLASVLRVVYLVFNEGFGAQHAAELVDESLRLARSLVELLPEPEAEGCPVGQVGVTPRQANHVAERQPQGGEKDEPVLQHKGRIGIPLHELQALVVDRRQGEQDGHQGERTGREPPQPAEPPPRRPVRIVQLEQERLHSPPSRQHQSVRQ